LGRIFAISKAIYAIVAVGNAVSEMIFGVEEDQSSGAGLIFRVFADDDLQLEIAVIVVQQHAQRSGYRLSPGLVNFISFERAFHDIGDGSMFMARQRGGDKGARAGGRKQLIGPDQV
jgi:hypothetical protein